MQLLKALWALAGAALCCFVVLVLHSHFLKEGQLAAGTCEIVTLDRDSSQPRRTIARQTARCACRKGQIAGTTRARPACVDARIIKTKQWCDMLPCLEGEGCDLLINRSGWTCTQPGGRIKTTTNDRCRAHLFLCVSTGASSPAVAPAEVRGTCQLSQHLLPGARGAGATSEAVQGTRETAEMQADAVRAGAWFTGDCF
ncbi:chemokine-like protein TAFA-5 [Rhynchocyon petersi]